MSKINGKSLDARFMKLKLKAHWGTEQFCTHFGISPEEFNVALEKSFSGRAYDDFSRTIRKNDDEIESAMRKAASRIQFPEENATLLLEAKPDNVEEVLEKSEIEKLCEEKDRLKGEIIYLEGLRKDFLSQNYELREKLGFINENLKSLKAEVQKNCDEAKELIANISENKKEMLSIWRRISEKNMRVEEVTSKVMELSMHTVYVYSLGELEVFNSYTESPEDMKLSDSWKEIFSQLFSGELGESEQVDLMTRAQLRAVSKAKSIEKEFKKAGRKYEFVFEDKLVEELFQKI